MDYLGILQIALVWIITIFWLYQILISATALIKLKDKPLIKNKNHLVLKTSHPSPLSANKGGWFNTNVFIKCNNFLKQHNLKEIDWANINQK